MRTLFALWLAVTGILSLPVFGQTLTSSNLPIVLISTNGQTILDDPKIVADLTIIDNGAGKANRTTDTPTFVSKIGIELRGSSSQMFPKKPYGFELRDAMGTNSVNASVLGMPSESDWVLNAMYDDKTLIREALTFDLNRQFSKYYTPRYRFCEVVLNGQYNGVYMLQEKIKRDKNRVNISSLKATDASGDALTGGYIFKIDKFTGTDSRDWDSPYKINNITIPIQIDYPKLSDVTEVQYQYAKKYVTDFENALAGATFQDSATGYRKYIHDDSFVDYFLLTEICHNLDGYRLSTYFYKDRDSKDSRLIMGPIWDYNLTYGNANYCNGDSYRGWSYAYANICPQDGFQVPFWWDRLLSDPRFAASVRSKYQALRQGLLKTERVQGYVDSVATMLTDARVRNFQRWPIIGVYTWPNSFVGKTYESETDYLKTFIKNRLEWMDTAILTLKSSVLAAESTLEFSLTISPNPSSGDAVLTYRLAQKATVQWSLTDESGRVFLTETRLNQAPGDHREVLPARTLPGAPGVYFFQLKTDDKLVNRKLLRF